MKSETKIVINSYLDTGIQQTNPDFEFHLRDTAIINDVHDILLYHIKVISKQFAENFKYKEKTINERFALVKEQLISEILIDWKIVTTTVSFTNSNFPEHSYYDDFKVKTVKEEIDIPTFISICEQLSKIILNPGLIQTLKY